MNKILDDFTATEEIPVRWGDMDARGHVNNTVYYRFFESSRITLLRFLNIYEQPTEVRVGPILSFQSCVYKAPLTYPDTVTVGAKIIKVEESKIIIEHALYSEKLKRRAAEGEAHIVWYDYSKKKKAKIPDKLRQELINSI
ncbi:MAG: acyl-CoA thioesterase [Promethearchaeota archaeon]|jgi:acyl-CoA thioester hydrolase